MPGGIQVSLVELERLVAEGHSHEAGRVFLQLLVDDCLTQADLGKACYLAAIAKSQAGEARSAVELSEMAEQHAAASGDLPLLGAIWANGAEHYLQMGDYRQAERRCRVWLSNLPIYPEPRERLGQVHLTLAHLYRAQGQQGRSRMHADEAITALSQEWEKTKEKRVARLLLSALQLSAWVLYEQGWIVAGDARREQAERYLADGDTEGTTGQVLLLGLKAYMIEDYKAVDILCRDLLGGSAQVDSPARFWAWWLLGMAAVHQGQSHVAREMSVTCSDLAGALSQPYLLDRAVALRKAAREVASIAGTISLGANR